MRRLSGALLALLMLISITACGGKAQATYQEQYDLGAKYLSEGNYEQAVIAFTAAIKIDPKQADAYTSRGDAYVQLAASGDETAGEDYENAAADYKQSIELDGSDADAYLKLAQVYRAQGDADSAEEILRQGYDATGDERLRQDGQSEQESENQDHQQEIVLTGTVRMNSEVYTELQSLDSDTDTYPSFGLFLTVPATLTVDGTEYTVTELSVYYGSNDALNSGMFDYLGKPVTVSGEVIYIGAESQMTTRTDQDGSSEEVLSHHCNGALAICVETIG